MSGDSRVGAGERFLENVAAAKLLGWELSDDVMERVDRIVSEMFTDVTPDELVDYSEVGDE